MNVKSIKKRIISEHRKYCVGNCMPRAGFDKDFYAQSASSKIIKEIIQKELYIEYASGFEAGMSFNADSDSLSQPASPHVRSDVPCKATGITQNDVPSGELSPTSNYKDVKNAGGNPSNNVCDEHYHCKGEPCNERCIIESLSQPSDNTLPTCVGSESKGLLVNDMWRSGELKTDEQVYNDVHAQQSHPKDASNKSIGLQVPNGYSIINQQEPADESPENIRECRCGETKDYNCKSLCPECKTLTKFMNRDQFFDLLKSPSTSERANYRSVLCLYDNHKTCVNNGCGCSCHKEIDNNSKVLK